MPETGFGGVDVTVSYTDRYVFSDGVPMPTGRPMANGSRACLITTVRAFIAGRGAGRTYNIQLGPSETGNRGVGSAGSAVNTGWQGLSSNFLAQGGSTRMTLNFSGSTYFGRSRGGQGTDSYGRNFGMLGGGYLWAQGPSEPNFVGVYDDQGAGTIRTDFRGSVDDGGAGISSYLLEYAWDPGFTTGYGYILTGTGQQNINGLKVGQRHYFRASARNAVTDAAGTTGAYSNVVSAVAPGVPSAPRNFRVTNSTTEVNTVTFSWDPPADTAGGITEYWVGSTGAIVGTTTGATSLTVRNLQSNFTTNYSVRARNAFAVRTGQFSDYSNTVVNHTTTDVPSEPRSVTAVASPTIAGQITVSWQPPAIVGTGITKYTLYSATGAIVADNISSGTRSYNVTGLTPGTYYGFYLVAWNAIATSVGRSSAKSATAGDTSLGDPGIPLALRAVSSSAVPGRLTLSWAVSGPYTGFNVYEIVSGVAVPVMMNLKSPSIKIDGLSPTVHTYVVSARNSVTDSTNPVSEGPRSARFSGTPGTSATQTVLSSTVVNQTNTALSATATIIAATARSFSYSATTADIGTTAVVSGTVTDLTNQSMSITTSIAAIPSSTTFQYTKGGSAEVIPEGTAVTNGSVTNVSNSVFTTSSTGSTVTAVDNTNRTVSYAATGANVSSRAATGTIINRSNSIYNGTYTLISTTDDTLSYYKAGANTVAETGATGTVFNNSNNDYFNAVPGVQGSVVVLDVPAYNRFTYLKAGTSSVRQLVKPPYGSVYRASSRATLRVNYRAGWLG